MGIALLRYIVVFIKLCVLHSAIIKDPKSCRKYPCLIFHDNFNKFDLKTWEHLKTRAATGNEEFQYYTNNRTNSFVKHGILYLKPTLTNETFDDDFLTSGTLDLWGSSPSTYCTSNRDNVGCYGKASGENMINPIQSAGIRTEKSFSFKYGKMEVRAKMPKGDWIWPAVWLMPKYNVYGEWPASGEIDLLESRGNDELYIDGNRAHPVGNKMVSQSLHWGPYYPENGQYETLIHVVKQDGRYSDDFHVYGFEWTENNMTFTIDNRSTLNVTVDESFWEFGKFANLSKGVDNPWEMGTDMAPFDEEFYIIMNVAIGGTNSYFADELQPKPPWKNDDDGPKAMIDFWNARETWLKTWHCDNTAMKVDYVKVWALDDTCETTF